MSKFIIVLFALTSLVTLQAKMYQSVSLKKATILVEKSRPWCSGCGMHLAKFYKTNHALKLKSGIVVQLCSLHCLVERREAKKEEGETLVVANDTLKFIPVERAYYVIASKVAGTMSKTSKYAFSSKDYANRFIKKYGGRIVRFKRAYDLAKHDFPLDMHFISSKRRKRVFPIGKKIAERFCDSKKLDLLHGHTIVDLKFKIKQESICESLKERQLQMLSVYLMMKKKGYSGTSGAIKVPKDAKCPICGMFIAKFPKWVALIKNGKDKKYFDGAKDFFKFYLKRRSGKLLVTDYYSITGIDAKKAYYVLGSNVFGPMGKELVPFLNKDQAARFMRDHKGTKILTFSEVTLKIIHTLDH